MKKLVAYLLIISAMCGFAFAQSGFLEFDKAKEIKLLESTRNDVGKVLANHKLKISNDSHYYQQFSGENINFTISYSDGVCTDDLEDWNVPEWKVTLIEISFNTAIQIEDTGIDFSKLRKERHYANYPDSYIYHDRDSGIAFEVDENKIKRIFLFPPKKSSSLLCDKKTAERYYSGKSIFGKSKLKDRVLVIDTPAGVDDVTLSATEISASCFTLNSAQNKACSDSVKEVKVSTVSTDTENNLLTYNYHVSGGKIIGQGAKVVWDLTGVKAGTYTITAGVDDGCGVCGETKTKTVIVKQCPDCSVK